MFIRRTTSRRPIKTKSYCNKIVKPSSVPKIDNNFVDFFFNDKQYLDSI